ncbi:MAG: hypothetical protein ACTJLK_02765, partial [Anaplasma sp.]
PHGPASIRLSCLYMLYDIPKGIAEGYASHLSNVCTSHEVAYVTVKLGVFRIVGKFALIYPGVSLLYGPGVSR